MRKAIEIRISSLGEYVVPDGKDCTCISRMNVNDYQPSATIVLSVVRDLMLAGF